MNLNVRGRDNQSRNLSCSQFSLSYGPSKILQPLSGGCGTRPSIRSWDEGLVYEKREYGPNLPRSKPDQDKRLVRKLSKHCFFCCKIWIPRCGQLNLSHKMNKCCNIIWLPQTFINVASILSQIYTFNFSHSQLSHFYTLHTFTLLPLYTFTLVHFVLIIIRCN